MLPPHFIMEDHMANKFLKEAMGLLYRSILNTWAGTSANPKGLLLCCLASMISHSEWILYIASKDNSHHFDHVTIFAFADLLIELKA